MPMNTMTISRITPAMTKVTVSHFIVDCNGCGRNPGHGFAPTAADAIRDAEAVWGYPLHEFTQWLCPKCKEVKDAVS